MALDMPPRVWLRDVTAREGAETALAPLPTVEKLALVDALADAGLPRIEVTAFLPPGLAPYLEDNETVMTEVVRRHGTRYGVVVTDQAGAARAVATHPDEISVLVSASETHSERHTGRSIAQALAEAAYVAQLGREARVPVSAYIVAAFGCPYEGRVSSSRVMEIAFRLYSIGVTEVTLCDTVGAADPLRVQQLYGELKSQLPGLTLGLHLHDTRGTALANFIAGLDAGCVRFDTGLGGIGGARETPGSQDLLATEEAVAVLDAMDVETGVDLTRLMHVGDWLEKQLGRALPSKLRRAGGPLLPRTPRGGAPDIP
jgi:hydroxymethylglutaryl-CoA lyase